LAEFLLAVKDTILPFSSVLCTSDWKQENQNLYVKAEVDKQPGKIKSDLVIVQAQTWFSRLRLSGSVRLSNKQHYLSGADHPQAQTIKFTKNGADHKIYKKRQRHGKQFF